LIASASTVLASLLLVVLVGSGREPSVREWLYASAPAMRAEGAPLARRAEARTRRQAQPVPGRAEAQSAAWRAGGRRHLGRGMLPRARAPDGGGTRGA
jgi:hypothetical protein